MGRELQKAKRRSGISKARKKPKSKKKLLQHPIIAANWDKNQTLAQNYARIGLTAKLGKSTGGVEKKADDVIKEREGGAKEDGLRIDGSRRKAENIEVTEARIERDPETGAILSVIDDGSVKANPLNDPLNDLDSDSEDSQFAGFDEHGNEQTHDASLPAKTDVVEKLEQQANRPVTKYKRRQPEGEVAFVEALVKKYGDDYGKMARDMKINYMQRSEGDLKRRIKKWRESGGVIE